MFDYDSKSGELLWKTTKHRRLIGKPAGNISKYSGYRRISMKDKCYYSHRVVWAWHYGAILESQEIDHVNTIKSDNRIENLRIVSRRENQQNRPKIKGTSSSFIGVCWDKVASKWIAYCTDGSGRAIKLGRFFLELDAARVVESYNRGIKGEFFNEKTSVDSILKQKGEK